MPFLVTVVLALGLALPSFTQAAAHSGLPAVPTCMAAMGMGHSEVMPTPDGGPCKAGHACRLSCPLCALTYSGVILPVTAPMPPIASRPHAAFAAEPRLGNGVPAPLDPYPPKPAAQG